MLNKKAQLISTLITNVPICQKGKTNACLLYHQRCVSGEHFRHTVCISIINQACDIGTLVVFCHKYVCGTCKHLIIKFMKHLMNSLECDC